MGHGRGIQRRVTRDLATFRNGGLDYDEAMRVNAEGTHLLLEHCRGAKAALIMSTAEVYKPQLDPEVAFLDRRVDRRGDDPFRAHRPQHPCMVDVKDRLVLREASSMPGDFGRITARSLRRG